MQYISPNEGSFLGIFWDVISKVDFLKKVLSLIFRISVMTSYYVENCPCSKDKFFSAGLYSRPSGSRNCINCPNQVIGSGPMNFQNFH